MREIHFRSTDEEYPAIIKGKGKNTWKELIYMAIEFKKLKRKNKKKK